MQRLWGKLWFRIVAAIAATPVIMTGGTIVARMAYVTRTHGGAGAFDPELIFPVPHDLAIIIPIGYAMAALAMIVAEMANRRHTRPIPPLICVLLLFVAGAGFVWLTMTMIEIAYRLVILTIPVFVVLLICCAVASLAASLALLSPLILRWHKESRSAGDMAGMF